MKFGEFMKLNKINDVLSNNRVMANEIIKTSDSIEDLFSKVSGLIEQARSYVKTSVNTTEVYTKYYIGKYIVEYEQSGNVRAEYGKRVLKDLSRKLIARFEGGWSVDTLEKCRKLFLVYSKSATVLRNFEKRGKSATLLRILGQSENEVPDFLLSWSHYLILMRIKNDAERNFYEIECANQHWGVRQLQRQVGSCLYERLALSRDKDEVMRLAKEGQTVEKPSDVIKSPLTLEFLGLKPNAAYSESKLENAIISKMQQFLLELGKGFLFEARQKRFTFDEDNYYVDLVFYNRLLQCYVLIDLKTDKLSHQDLGQMQMYVNYYDRFVKQDFEKPTIGILLCESKNDALVELTLPKDSHVYASAYQLYLPDKALLQAKVREWIAEFEENNIE